MVLYYNGIPFDCNYSTHCTVTHGTDVRALAEDFALLKAREPLKLVDNAIIDIILPVANELEECGLVVIPVLELLELEEQFAPVQKV